MNINEVIKQGNKLIDVVISTTMMDIQIESCWEIKSIWSL